MLLLTEALRGAWLVERAGRWATVGGVAGTGFDAYVRLLHPVDAHRTDTDTTDEFGGPSTSSTPDGITDDEQARVWPDGWRVDQSDDEWFDPEDLEVLTDHLRVATRTPDDLVVGVWEGTGNPPWAENGGDRRARARMRTHWPGRDRWLFSANVNELADSTWAQRTVPGWESSRHSQDGPCTSLIWPEDHAWVVASEEDWDSTIVAGSRGLIDSVLADGYFEAFEVHEADDLSWDGDLLNPRRPPGRPEVR